MNPAQEEVCRYGLLDSPFSCVLQMATGSGKTWLGEQTIRKTVERGARAIYVSPLRALASEVTDVWSRKWPDYRVGVFTGDFGQAGRPYPVSFQNAQVLVMTPERMDACTRNWRSHWKWIPHVDLVVVDELHLLGEARRGPKLEGAISRFRRLNPFARFLGLSATMGNPEQVADWLEGIVHRSAWRPIPLVWRVVRYKKATDKPNLLSREVAATVGKKGRVLVFVQSRRRAELLAAELADQGLRSRHHHAGLTHAERQQVEQAARDGQIDVIVSTATLELGLNLPVRQVILYDLQTFDGSEFQPLSTNTVWQRAGRAGRPGLDTEGEVLLFAPTWDRCAASYEKGVFEDINSQLRANANLAEQILTEVASGFANNRTQVQAALSQSFAAHQGRINSINANVEEILAAGFLTEFEDEQRASGGLRLRATRLGRIAVRHMLSPRSVLVFKQATEKFTDELTFFDLVLLTAVSDECEPILTVDFEELGERTAQLAEHPSALAQMGMKDLLLLLGVTPRRLLSAIKMAISLRLVTRGGSHATIAESMECYEFEIVRLIDSTVRLLQALQEVVSTQEVSSTVEEDQATLKERVEALRHMIKYGVDECTATLCFVPGIGGKYASGLAALGITDIEELAAAEPQDLTSLKGVSTKRATDWINRAEILIESRHGFSFRESTSAKPRLAIPDWPNNIDPYRLRRARELSVVPIASPTFRVTGGMEPHLVRHSRSRYQCDCVDFQNGNQCKHVLAVKLHEGDAELANLIRILSRTDGGNISLYDLWFDMDQRNRRAI